jgi:hypothetical protein
MPRRSPFVEHLVLGDAADLTALETLKPLLGPVRADAGRNL